MGIGDGSSDVCSSDLRTSEQKVRIAPDGRSEMAVASKRQTEMAQIAGAVIGLRLRSENLLHNLRPVRDIAHPLQKAVESARLDDLPQREFDVEGAEIFLECRQLLPRRRLMDAVHDGGFLRLQRICRRDIGRNHEILYQRSEEHTS